jgi:hypothetical protein
MKNFSTSIQRFKAALPLTPKGFSKKEEPAKTTNAHSHLVALQSNLALTPVEFASAILPTQNSCYRSLAHTGAGLRTYRSALHSL